jgi:putative oxidoreductase
MIPLISLARVLAPYREYGLFIRLIVGYRLVWGTADNVFSWARMVEFAEFLGARGVPLPLVGAVVSAYAQFLCGLLFIAGAATRPAAALMIVNFIAALAIAHIGQPFLENHDALVMLFGSCFLLLHGPGKLSVDERGRLTPAGLGGDSAVPRA